MRTVAMTLAITLPIAAACGRETPAPAAQLQRPVGRIVAVTDTTVADLFDAAGTASPVRQATLATRLMGAVTEVQVREGERVASGQLLLRIDARDLEARRARVEAGLSEATAVHQEATLQASRIRALYADSAATKSQLDQAETGLARAVAGLASARAAAAELAANAAYSELRAPFAGVVTRRFVDPGSFAGAGAPLLIVEDASSLRISVSAAPEAVRGLTAGSRIAGMVGDSTVRATIEGVVPAGANLYTVNALVSNASGRLLSGSPAILRLPRGTRRALLVPAAALVREGELAGVRVASGDATALRWVSIGRPGDGLVEILAGVSAGDSVFVPEAGR